MRTMLRSKVTLLFLAFGMIYAAIPAVAFATDALFPDADTVTTNIQGSKNLGTVAPGATVNTPVDLLCPV